MPDLYEAASRLERRRTHQRIELVENGAKELCTDCGGVEDELRKQTCMNRQTQNRATHRNIELVTEGELAYCKDCSGGEVQLFEATCEARIASRR